MVCPNLNLKSIRYQKITSSNFYFIQCNEFIYLPPFVFNVVLCFQLNFAMRCVKIRKFSIFPWRYAGAIRAYLGAYYIYPIRSDLRHAIRSSERTLDSKKSSVDGLRPGFAFLQRHFQSLSPPYDCNLQLV